VLRRLMQRFGELEQEEASGSEAAT
jgi:hypothetical protein